MENLLGMKQISNIMILQCRFGVSPDPSQRCACCYCQYFLPAGSLVFTSSLNPVPHLPLFMSVHAILYWDCLERISSIYSTYNFYNLYQNNTKLTNIIYILVYINVTFAFVKNFLPRGFRYVKGTLPTHILNNFPRIITHFCSCRVLRGCYITTPSFNISDDVLTLKSVYVCIKIMPLSLVQTGHQVMLQIIEKNQTHFWAFSVTLYNNNKKNLIYSSHHNT